VSFCSCALSTPAANDFVIISASYYRSFALTPKPALLVYNLLDMPDVFLYNLFVASARRRFRQNTNPVK